MLLEVNTLLIHWCNPSFLKLRNSGFSTVDITCICVVMLYCLTLSLISLDYTGAHFIDEKVKYLITYIGKTLISDFNGWIVGKHMRC